VLRLRSLYLRGTSVTDATVPGLKQHKDLMTLDLRGSHITDAGVKELRKALSKAKIDR
jgi:hypothetical protein